MGRSYDIQERVISSNERYDRSRGVFVIEAKCPFCQAVSSILRGETTKGCAHFLSAEHGCGGGAFRFASLNADAVAA